MADYSNYPFELKQKMAFLKQQQERQIKEIANEFKDKVSEEELLMLHSQDMGFADLAPRRMDNYYYKYLSENSSYYPNGVAGASKAYTAMSDDEKKKLKDEFQTRQLNRAAKVQMRKENSIKSLQKLANKLYTENGLHVISYVTVRKPLVNIAHDEEYAVYGTSCAAGFDKSLFEIVGSEKTISSMFRDYVMLNDSGEVCPQAIVRGGRFRTKSVPRTEAQEKQARRRTMFNRRIIGLMDAACKDRQSCRVPKTVPWAELAKKGRVGNLVLMGWPRTILIKNKISIKDMKKIEELIEDKTIFFARPENPNTQARRLP